MLDPHDLYDLHEPLPQHTDAGDSGPVLLHVLTGFVTNFFDALGIGSFLMIGIFLGAYFY